MNNAAARLAVACNNLRPFAVGATRPAVMLATILVSLEAGDHVTALNEIRAFGDAAERSGVAARLAPMFGQLLDAHGLCVLASLPA